MYILEIEVSYDTSEHLYLVKVGKDISTFTQYLDAKEFIDNKVRRIFWKHEDMLKTANTNNVVVGPKKK